MAVAEPAAEQAANPEVKRLGVFNQLIRFVVVGGGCAIIDYGTYMALLAGLGWPAWVSKTISFILGTTASYLINRKFTFSGAGTGNAGAKAGAFAVLYTVTFFVNVGTNQLLIWLTSPYANWQFTLIWVVAQGLGTLINFVMLKWVVFRD
ncbi:putative flippase GtrA [Saccharopolyspora erythraea NRRL 2338]|uniref:GtrA-like protein n=2 Tax=Saccharopolyspora erythraea TaxID=1836 RepID=A4F674_SACEN|nr:GtrA family protein [Saccharopolyspora erythraea]EQD88035.1 polysaccharide synthesis protein GtrA [Saccharopolyspora erythraea D]PFG93349.1 putative flippase GtrA [Saccharopolyspora erythraea NRRL 2338]QRK90187.1 GtrA family protein [Saccharopolyspora erythraea]CAL99548.1 GtrA-like protein [Saccharopolyspora erythraea NRRL 2338]